MHMTVREHLLSLPFPGQKDEGPRELGNCLCNEWPGIQRKVKDVNWREG